MLSINLTTAPILTATETMAPSCPTSSISLIVTGQPTDKYSIAVTSGSADRTASTAARISLREACLRHDETVSRRERRRQGRRKRRVDTNENMWGGRGKAYPAFVWISLHFVYEPAVLPTQFEKEQTGSNRNLLY